MLRLLILTAALSVGTDGLNPRSHVAAPIGSAVGDVHMVGYKLTLDLDKDTYIYSSADDVFDLFASGALYFQLTTTNATLDVNAVLDDCGTDCNSYYLSLSADNSTTAQEARLQVMYGADPYLRILAPDNSGTATAVLDIHDTAITYGAATAGVDYSITIDGEDSDVTLTHDEDNSVLIVSESVTVGAGAAGVDYKISFDGETTDGYLLYDEDNALLQSDRSLVVGVGAAGVDYTVKFDGEDSDGTITYDEDNSLFSTDRDITIGVALADKDYVLKFDGEDSDGTITHDEDNSVLIVNESITVGSAGAGIDYIINFDGEDSDGYLLYDEDNALFQTSRSMTIGTGAAGVDYVLKFDGEDSDGNITFDEDNALFAYDHSSRYLDCGTSCNSHLISMIADNSTTPQEGTFQVIYGADPYIRLSAPNDSGTATPTLDLHDQTISYGNGAAGIDYSFVFNGEDSDGTITYDEDNSAFLFDQDMSLTDCGTSCNSSTISMTADNATTTQTGTIQVAYGANPYIRISAPNDAGAATTTLDITDTSIDFGDGAAGIDYSITFDGQDSDGTITYDEDNAKFISDRSIVIGNGAAGVDYTISFDGESNDGLITYDEDNDRFTVGETVQTNSQLWLGNTNIKMSSGADGNLLLTDTSGTAFDAIALGGTSSSYPAILRNSNFVQFKKADESDYTYTEAKRYVGQTSYGANFSLQMNTQVVTCSNNPSITTPTIVNAGSWLYGVTTRNIVALSGPTSMKIGDGVDDDIFGVQNTMTQGATTGNGDRTAAFSNPYGTDQGITLTFVGGNCVTGSIVVVAYLMYMVPPTRNTP